MSSKRRAMPFRPNLTHLEDRTVPAGPTSFADPVDLLPGPNPVYEAFQEAIGDQPDQTHILVPLGQRVIVGVSAADLNGDGVQDLVSTHELTNTVSVLLGLGGGAYGPARSFAAGSAPSALAVADFDGDGDQDVAVVNEAGVDQVAYGANDAGVSLLLGDGQGGLGPPIPAAQGGITPIALAVGRFDGGTLPELAVADLRAGGVLILKWNDLARTLATQTAFLTPRLSVTDVRPIPITGLAAETFHGDAGYQGLVVTAETGAWVYLNRGTGPLGEPIFGKRLSAEDSALPEPDQRIDGLRGRPNGVVSADFNRDGIADLAITSSLSATVSILPGLGGAARGMFAAEPSQVLPASDWMLAAGDVNGDGAPDLAFSHFVGNTVRVLENIGNGRFREFREYWAGEHPTGIAMIPSADGHGDIVVGRTADGQVSLLANRKRPAPSDGVSVLRDVYYGIDTSGNALTDDPLSAFRRLDLFVPSDVENYPVLVYLHGGPPPEMPNFSRHGFDFLWRSLAAQGICVASISISGLGSDGFAAEDMAMAFAWAKHHIAEYRGDPGQLFGIGHSAIGAGTIAAVAGQSNWLEKYGLHPADVLRGAILLSQGWIAASLEGDRFPPLLFLMGTQSGESLCAPLAAQYMASLVPADGAIQWDIIAGRDHFTLPANAARDADPARQILLGFINDRLAGIAPTTGIAIVNEDGSRVGIDLSGVAMTYDVLLAIAEALIEQEKKR